MRFLEHEKNSFKVINFINNKLFSDEHDPFNRSVLKIEELQAAEDIKSRIEIWIKQKLEGVETDEEKRQKEMETKQKIDEDGDTIMKTTSVEEKKESAVSNFQDEEIDEEEQLRLAMQLSLLDQEEFDQFYHP